MAVFDEVAYYSATVGTKTDRETFSVLLRDLVARGRAAGISVIAATQRPSSDIIPTSLRDLFGYRWAFRCTTDSSSDIVLGAGWASRGHFAADIALEDKGIGLLLAEGGQPQRIKSAFLTDEQVEAVAERAAELREPTQLRGGVIVIIFRAMASTLAPSPYQAQHPENDIHHHDRERNSDPRGRTLKENGADQNSYECTQPDPSEEDTFWHVGPTESHRGDASARANSDARSTAIRDQARALS